MLHRLRQAKDYYPKQYWLMLFGMLISTTGASMIWPFLMIYVSDRLSLPLTKATSLLSISAIMGITFSFLAGPIVDRFGRKWMMVFSLAANSIGYLLLSQANTYAAFAAVMALNGSVNPLYRVGADAMMADLIEKDKRADAYSLLRMSNNVGVALGPAIGGYLASVTYNTAFYCAAAGLMFFSVLILFFARETLPKSEAHQKDFPRRERFGGYGSVLKDYGYLGFVLAFTLTQVGAMQIWSLLGVYAKQNYGLSERLYGLIPTTNAIMVVVLQYAVTQVTKRFATLPVMGVGAFFYAVAVTGIFFSQGFWGFWVCMVIMTIGELIQSPTASTHVANLAPPAMRGRYMGIFGLTHSGAQSVGPLLGGFLSDTYGPSAIWLGGGAVSALSTALYFLIYRPRKNQTWNTD